MLAYMDLDVSSSLSRRSLCAAFVAATDTRYNFSSASLNLLGGSELSRLPEFYETDHDWSDRGPIDPVLPTRSSRVVLELLPDVAPLACENFLALCRNPANAPAGESGKPQTYVGCPVHRVQSGFVLQAGDFVFGTGSGGESVFGKKFKDERAGLALKHDRKGVLSMGNSGKNSNTSQFFITLGEGGAPQCDGKHVVFGRVVAGFEVLDAVEAAAGTASGEPAVPVSITACGAFEPATPVAGYWLKVPDDSFAGSTPVFYVMPRVLVVAGNAAAAARFGQGACAGGRCDVREVVGAAGLDGVANMDVDLVVVAKALAGEIGEKDRMKWGEKLWIGAPADVGERVRALGLEKGWTLDNRRAAS